LGVGIGKAFRVLCRRIIARPEWRWVLPFAVAGSAAIVVTWMRGGEHWRNMLSVLVGLATGGGMIWMIRLMGGAVLQREAMGFGDVTLMAMIGAFIGWQAVLVVFFLAAIFGLVAGLLQWLINGDNVIPYGPFLCLGALVMVAFWSPIWDYFSPFFEFQWLVPTVILLCLPPLPFLLYALKRVRERFSASS
jgi:prepilin signal peptidase PulO-like enzyme (type II secretory pathway)